MTKQASSMTDPAQKDSDKVHDLVDLKRIKTFNKALAQIKSSELSEST